MLVMVALVMGAMVLALAMPVFARPHGNLGHCHKQLNDGFITGGTNSEFNQEFNPPKSQGNQEGGRATCRDFKPQQL